MKIGWGVICSFEIQLNKNYLSILQKIRSFFGLFSPEGKTWGNIFLKSDGSCVYHVGSQKDLLVIIDHFNKYPLVTNKYADYILFKMAVNSK